MYEEKTLVLKFSYKPLFSKQKNLLAREVAQPLVFEFFDILLTIIVENFSLMPQRATLQSKSVETWFHHVTTIVNEKTKKTTSRSSMEM